MAVLAQAAKRAPHHHLEVRANEIENSVEARVRAAGGSDRHLELLAAEVESARDK